MTTMASTARMLDDIDTSANGCLDDVPIISGGRGRREELPGLRKPGALDGTPASHPSGSSGQFGFSLHPNGCFFGNPRPRG